MANHTSFRIGGVADYFVTPSGCDEVVKLVKALKEAGEQFIVIGNGSNLLVSDKGYRGVVISISKKMSEITVCKDVLNVEAGALLSRISSVALKHSLAGFEFASGIPGCLGGAVVMNAGAYGGEIKDVVIETTYVSCNGEVKTVKGEEHNFGYRRS